MLVLVGAPAGEHAAGELEALFAEGLLLGEAFCVAAEVALHVRPAGLSAIGAEVLVAGPAVGDHDPLEGADQRVELLAIAVLGDLKDRSIRGGHRPQRAGIPGGPPAGLIDMQRVLAANPVAQPLIRRRAGPRRAGRSRPRGHWIAGS